MKDATALDQSTLNCVRECYKNAKDDDYGLDGTDEEIASDMIAFTDLFDKWTSEQLAPYIRKVREDDNARTNC